MLHSLRTGGHQVQVQGGWCLSFASADALIRSDHQQRWVAVAFSSLLRRLLKPLQCFFSLPLYSYHTTQEVSVIVTLHTPELRMSEFSPTPPSFPQESHAFVIVVDDYHGVTPGERVW